MAEYQEDIITQEDPIPKGKLADTDRAKLDSIVSKMITNKESDDAINAVVEDFKTKYTTQQQPAIKTEPVSKFKPMSDWLNIPQQGYQPIDQANVVPIDDHTINTAKAADRVRKETETIDPHIGNLIYDKKKEVTGRINSQALGVNPKEAGPLNPQAALLESKLRKDVEVHPEEIEEYKAAMTGSPGMFRDAISQKIKDVSKTDPSKANQLKADMYRVDAQDRSDKEVEIQKNEKKLKDGELEYDPRRGLLYKSEGFFPSIVTGFKQKNQLFKDYELYTKTINESAIIKELNDRIKDQDPDKPAVVPDGEMGEIGAMLGGQPIKPIVGAIGAGIATSGLGAAAAGAAISAHEMYKLGYASALPNNYAAIKREHPDMPDYDAYQQAKALSENQATTDAATGAAMGAVGAKGALKPASLVLQKSVKSALKQIGETVAIEGLGGGAIGAGGQYVKNIMAQKAGIPVDESEGMAQQLVGGVFMTLGMSLAGKFGDLLKPSTKNQLFHGLSKLPEEVISSELNKAQEVGALTPEEVQKVQTDLTEQKKVDASIRGDVPESDRIKVQEKIKQRDAKEKELETAHKAYHPEIKEEIKKLDDDILAISKGSERGELQQLVDKSKIEGAVKASLRDLDEKELKGAFKEIAEQAHDPNSANQTLEVFGEEIVNKAKELYPQEAETITIKPNENAISERSTAETPVDETTGHSPEVGTGIPESGEAAIPQEGSGSKESSTESQEGLNPMEGGIPPNMHDLPFTPEAGDVGRLAHADTEQIYRDLGMTERIPRATKEDTSLELEADNLIKDGYDFEGKADRVLSGRDKSFTDVEQVAFAKMVGALNVKLQKLEVNTPEFNATLDTIERLSRASDKVGSEEGAAFRARRMFVLNDETLSAFMQKAKEANLDVPLTPEQAAAVKGRFDDLQASRDAYRARVEKLAAENAKLKAEGVVKKAKAESKTNTTKRTHDDYVKERQDIIAKMKEDLLKVAKGGKGAMVSLPGAAQLAAIAPHVAKIVKSLVNEGIDKLPDLINAIHEQIKDVIPGINEKQIHDIIAGEYSKKQTRTDIQEKIYEIGLQAKMINRLEALKAGVQPKLKGARLKRNAEIEDLRKQIKDLQYPEKQEKVPVAKTEAEKEAAKLSALKARYKKQTDELQKKIDTGDFEPDEKSTIGLDKEAQDLKDAYIKKKIEWQKTVAQDAYNNRSQWQKKKDFVSEVLGIPRTIMASADLSAPLRQGLVLTASHPIVASKAFVESIRQIVSPERFDRWLYDLKESPYYKNVIEKSGLYVADPNNLHLSNKEEAFRTNLAEKIPLLGPVIKGSERAYVAFLNKLRVDVFTMYAKAFSEQGMTPETRPDLYEGLGAFINAATGRGELGDLEPAAGVLNAAFFSPRLMAARINMLNPVWYASLPKEVRIMALKDMGKMIALGATTLTLASLAGAKVERDPRSTDFGKIHVGNTRWDIWGGFQQYVRVASQLISGYEKKGDGSIVPLGNERGQHTRAEKLLGLFRGKLAPVPGIATDLLTGKTAVGEEVELKPQLKEHLIPMIANDVADAWKEQGPMSILYTGVPSFLGVGTTTYEQKASGGSHSGKPGKAGKPSKPTKNTKK